MTFLISDQRLAITNRDSTEVLLKCDVGDNIGIEWNELYY